MDMTTTDKVHRRRSSDVMAISMQQIAECEIWLSFAALRDRQSASENAVLQSALSQLQHGKSPRAAEFQQRAIDVLEQRGLITLSDDRTTIAGGEGLSIDIVDANSADIVISMYGPQLDGAVCSNTCQRIKFFCCMEHYAADDALASGTLPVRLQQAVEWGREHWRRYAQST
jgi:hypothetical protein